MKDIVPAFKQLIMWGETRIIHRPKENTRSESLTKLNDSDDMRENKGYFSRKRIVE